MDGGLCIQVKQETFNLTKPELNLFWFRLGNVPLMEPPSEEFQEIPFYEWAGAPVYPDFEFQEVRTKGGKTKTRLVLDLSPYTVSDLKRLETDQWCFLFNE